MLYVGIDWAVTIMMFASLMIQPKLWLHSGSLMAAKDLNAFTVLLRNTSPNRRKSWWHWRRSGVWLVHDLFWSGYRVYAINPKAVSRYKDRYVVSKAKTDSLDASCLAHLLRTDRHRFKPLVLLPDLIVSWIDSAWI